MASITTLYLVRHAIAAERGDEWPDDARRPLTHRGAARMREVVAGLDAMELGIGHVISSPLVRARQTADLMIAGLRPAPKLLTSPSLAPGHAPSEVLAAIADAPVHNTIALVGHEPDLGQLAAYLIGAKAPPVFKKGGVCRIDLPSLAPLHHGHLLWLATPAMLRALGREAR